MTISQSNFVLPSNTMVAVEEYIPPKSPYQKVSSQDLDFSVAFAVMDSWELVKRIPDWEQVAGKIFLRRYDSTN